MHSAAPGVAENVSLRQAVQLGAPTIEPDLKPAGQTVHSEAVSKLLAKPMAQERQDREPAAENLPVPQSLQELVVSANLPLVQAVHVLRPLVVAT